MRYRSAAIVCARCAFTLSALLAVPRSPAATNFVWINLSGGSWANPANWSPPGVPGAADQATITPSQSLTVTLPANTTVSNLVLGSAASQPTLSLNGFDLTVTSAQFAGGTLGGAGTLEIAGGMTWSGGRMVGPGSTWVRPGGTLTIDASTGDVRVDGRLLNNEGTTLWQSGRIITDGATIIENEAGALFDVSFDGVLSGTRTFNNAGLFRKTGGTGIMTMAGIFNNSGTNEVQAGTLSLTGGGTNSGTFLVASAAKLAFVAVATNFHRFDVTSRVTGAGSVAFNGIGTPAPTNEFSGTFDLSGMTTFGYGVTVNFTPAATLTSLGTKVTFSGGSAFLNSGADLTIPILNLTAGVLGGADTVTVTGPMEWMNSTLQGPGVVNANGGLTINANSSFTNDGPVWLDGRVLNNAGPAVWKAGQILTSRGSVIHNLTNATFEATGTNGILSGDSTFTNSGWFYKWSGSDTTAIAVPFYNAGGVEAQQGTLGFDLYLQTAGTNLLNGGQFAAVQPLQIQGGILRGTGDVFGSVSNAAAIHAGDAAGPIRISGSYTQTAGAVMNVDLPRLVTQANAIEVGGPAELNGRLDIGLDPAFPIVPYSSTVFLTYSGQTGAFSQTNYPTNLVGLRIDYAATAASIVITNTRPTNIVDVPDQTLEEMAPFSLAFSGYVFDSETTADRLTYTIFSNFVHNPTTHSINLEPFADIPNLTIANGLLQWTPAENQGPGTNVIALRICDLGTPPLCVTQSFTLTVQEINRAPTLAVPDTNINESVSTTLNLAVFASDPDIPTNELRFELVSVATTNPLFSAVTSTLPNMVLIPTNGALTWTPAEDQGPSTNVFTVRVWDSNESDVLQPHLTNTTSFTVVVNEVNRSPTLVGTNFTILEGTNQVVDLGPWAGDPDIPTNGLGFELVSVAVTSPMTNFTAPTLTNLTFDTSTGRLTWTPAEDQGPSTNVLTVRVSDTNLFDAVNPHLSATTDFTVIVQESNSPPVWAGIAPTNVIEATPLTLNLSNAVTDADLPANTLTFTLVSAWSNGVPVTVSSVVPPGALDPVTGVLNWTPTEAHGSNLFLLRVQATDNGVPPSSVATDFEVTVLESNLPPVWAGIAPTSIVETTPLTMNLSNAVSDVDLPPNRLTFALVAAWSNEISVSVTSVVPAGALTPDTGILTWTPTEPQGSNRFRFQVRATDDGTPSLSATQEFIVTVLESNLAPVFTFPPNLPFPSNTNYTFLVVTGSSLNFTCQVDDADIPANQLTFYKGTSLIPGGGGAANFSITNTPAGLVTWTVGTNLGAIRYMDVGVYDNGTPSLTNEILVKILLTNDHPAPAIRFPRANEALSVPVGGLFTTNIRVGNPDFPSYPLSFGGVWPTGAFMTNVGGNPFKSNGVITNYFFNWSTTLADAGTNVMTVIVTNQAGLTDSRTFSVVVYATNAGPPTLLLSNLLFWEQMSNVVALTATDPDLPPDSQFTYLFLNATNVAASGSITNIVVTNPEPEEGGPATLSWHPTAGQGPTTNHVWIAISDNQQPAKWSTNRVVIVVLEVQVTLTALGRETNGGTNLVVEVGANGGTNREFFFEGSKTFAGWQVLSSTNPGTNLPFRYRQPLTNGYQFIRSRVGP